MGLLQQKVLFQRLFQSSNKLMCLIQNAATLYFVLSFVLSFVHPLSFLRKVSVFQFIHSHFLEHKNRNASENICHRRFTHTVMTVFVSVALKRCSCFITGARCGSRVSRNTDMVNIMDYLPAAAACGCLFHRVSLSPGDTDCSRKYQRSFLTLTDRFRHCNCVRCSHELDLCPWPTLVLSHETLLECSRI